LIDVVNEVRSLVAVNVIDVVKRDGGVRRSGEVELSGFAEESV